MTLVSCVLQAAVKKAEELVLFHQEYQRGLHMFEDWLEQEQSNLALLSPLDGDVNTLEKTLKELHVSIECSIKAAFFCCFFSLYLLVSLTSMSHSPPPDAPVTLLRGPRLAEVGPVQSGAGHPMGCPSD